MGRGSYYWDPKLTEEQKEEQLAKLGENDPKIERLKAINEDKGKSCSMKVCRSMDLKDAGLPESTATVRRSATLARRRARLAAMELCPFAIHIGLAGTRWPPTSSLPQSTSATVSSPHSLPSTPSALQTSLLKQRTSMSAMSPTPETLQMSWSPILTRRTKSPRTSDLGSSHD